jgi:hypothetical protein
MDSLRELIVVTRHPNELRKPLTARRLPLAQYFELSLDEGYRSVSAMRDMKVFE